MIQGFTKKNLIDAFSIMYSSRRLDEKMLNLLKQGKSFFHMGASGLKRLKWQQHLKCNQVMIGLILIIETLLFV